jgi:hypothetical protein
MRSVVACERSRRTGDAILLPVGTAAVSFASLLLELEIAEVDIQSVPFGAENSAQHVFVFENDRANPSDTDIVLNCRNLRRPQEEAEPRIRAAAACALEGGLNFMWQPRGKLGTEVVP